MFGWRVTDHRWLANKAVAAVVHLICGESGGVDVVPMVDPVRGSIREVLGVAGGIEPLAQAHVEGEGAVPKTTLGSGADRFAEVPPKGVPHLLGRLADVGPVEVAASAPHTA